MTGRQFYIYKCKYKNIDITRNYAQITVLIYYLEDMNPHKNANTITNLEGRVGVRMNKFSRELHYRSCLQDIEVNDNGLFVIAPVSSARGPVYDDPETIDLAVKIDCSKNYDTGVVELEESSLIALEIGYPPLEKYTSRCAKLYKKLVEHALYLDSPAIYLQCPTSDLGMVTVASIINECVANHYDPPAIQLNIPIFGGPSHTFEYKIPDQVGWFSFGENNITPQIDTEQFNKNYTFNNDLPLTRVVTNRNTIQECDTAWEQWIAFKTYMGPMSKLSVCLEINDDITDLTDELLRWKGEKVQTISVNADLFIVTQRTANVNDSTEKVRLTSPKPEVRLSGRCKDFIRQVAIANSFKLSLVVDGSPGENLTAYVDYLKDLYKSFEQQNPDELRFVNDTLYVPLQPLSFNLSSSIYSVFEIDRIKYDSYEQAMFKALDDILNQKNESKKAESHNPRHNELVLMVLGAGRGPLVDAFLKALKKHQKKHFVKSKRTVKIYALDKNPSSVVALNHKLTTDWTRKELIDSGFSEDVAIDLNIEVVESDMRYWDPKCQADIVATELLGSMADNELSPECIDGAWKFSNLNTVSIPENYTSYIAPISAARVWQDLYTRNTNEDVSAFDRIHVCRFANIYSIAEEKELFSFQHHDISAQPVVGQNERYTKLTFKTQNKCVCHGFAGYFEATLYDDVTISTTPSNKTLTMESWFPMYIPLEQPIKLFRDEELVVHFWRKESNSKVWYEWVVTSPVRTRLHSMYGNSSALSKVG